MDEIRTERLLMRGWQAGDADALAEIMTPDVTRWLSSWPTPMTPAVALQRIAAMQAAVHQGKGLDYAIVRQADDRLIGGLAVKFADDPPACVKLGYYLGPGCQGRGYMREAAQAAIAHIWRRLPTEVIEAGAQLDNEASFAVMRAVGMQLQGERLVYAAARGREETCRFYQVRRPA